MFYHTAYTIWHHVANMKKMYQTATLTSYSHCHFCLLPRVFTTLLKIIHLIKVFFSNEKYFCKTRAKNTIQLLNNFDRSVITKN